MLCNERRVRPIPTNAPRDVFTIKKIGHDPHKCGGNDHISKKIKCVGQEEKKNYLNIKNHELI